MFFVSVSFPSFIGLFSMVNVSIVVIVAVVAVDSFASPVAADIICLLFVLWLWEFWDSCLEVRQC